MGFQSRIPDLEEWRSGIRFLERQGKIEAAREFRDVLRLVDEVDPENGVPPELVQWINALETVREAVKAWRTGSAKQKFFELYWQQYCSGRVRK